MSNRKQTSRTQRKQQRIKKVGHNPKIVSQLNKLVIDHKLLVGAVSEMDLRAGTRMAMLLSITDEEIEKGKVTFTHKELAETVAAVLDQHRPAAIWYLINKWGLAVDQRTAWDIEETNKPGSYVKLVKYGNKVTQFEVGVALESSATQDEVSLSDPAIAG